MMSKPFLAIFKFGYFGDISPKKFGRKCFWSKKMLVGNFLGKKKCWSEIFFGQKKFGRKYFWVKKCGSEILMGQKKFRS